MKTKRIAALAATLAFSSICAFAANPFVDVPSDSWAYQSVVELADAGIIQGVDGQYFQGNRNITRYEAAEMTAKAMAHMDKATVEQRALINKLADEYANELNNLGVRVSALENRVGNVKLTGDMRVRYRYQKDNKENDNSWDYRVRVRANAQVNDRTKVTYGVSTDVQQFSSNGSASDDNGDIYTDVAKVDYNFGSPNWNLSVGRTDDYILGGPRSYGYQHGDAFDRAELKYQSDKFAVTAGYGKFKAADGSTAIVGGKLGTDAEGNDVILDGLKMGYGEIEGFFGGGRMANSAVGVYYSDFTRSGGSSTGFVNGLATKEADADDLWGAYASLNFGKWNVLANYEKLSKDNYSLTTGSKVDDPEMWVGRVTYGAANIATPKTWDAWVEYLNADDGAYLYTSTNSWRWNNLDNVKSWGVGIDYTIAKNVMFSVMQSFGSETKDGNYKDPDEQSRAQFVFAF